MTTCLSHSKPHISEGEIKMSINLLYAEGISEERRDDILKSHKVISNFFIENTLCKLLCKLKD